MAIESNADTNDSKFFGFFFCLANISTHIRLADKIHKFTAKKNIDEFYPPEYVQTIAYVSSNKSTRNADTIFFLYSGTKKKLFIGQITKIFQISFEYKTKSNLVLVSLNVKIKMIFRTRWCLCFVAFLTTEVV